MREGGGRGVGDKVVMRANYRLLGLGVHDLLVPWQSWNVVCRVRNQTGSGALLPGAKLEKDRSPTL